MMRQWTEMRADGRLSLSKGEGEGEGLTGAGAESITFVLSPSARGEMEITAINFSERIASALNQ
jgi:hypothetical protein